MQPSPAPYRDRVDAGQTLAESLTAWREQQPLIVGIPRGGVVVARAVAESLGAELDTVIVRKVGAPHQPELAIGAVAPDGQVILDYHLIERMRINERALNALIAREQEEARRRLLAYRGARPPLDAADRTVIVVDDGLATGATMAIALRVLRTHLPHLLIAAAPVGSRFAIESLAPVADHVVCPHVPVDLVAVGGYYADFAETTDSTVQTILAETFQKNWMV